jgi:hypothetical protein
MAPEALDPLAKEMIYCRQRDQRLPVLCINSHTAAARKKGMTDELKKVDRSKVRRLNYIMLRIFSFFISWYSRDINQETQSVLRNLKCGLLTTARPPFCELST